MSVDRLRAMLSEATPGGWDLRVEHRHEEAWIEAGSLPLHIALADGRRNSDYEANARLIALTPDAIALLADMTEQMEAFGEILTRSRSPVSEIDERMRNLVAPMMARLDALCGDDRA